MKTKMLFQSSLNVNAFNKLKKLLKIVKLIEADTRGHKGETMKKILGLQKKNINKLN